MTKLSRSPDVQAFLEKARDAGLIARQTYRVLTDFLMSGEVDSIPAPSADPDPATPASPVSWAPPTGDSVKDPTVPAQAKASRPVRKPTPSPAEPMRPPPPPPPPAERPVPDVPPPLPPPPPPPPAVSRPPSRWRLRADELRAAIASDVAVHGFSYLGVVLTFIGVLGFLLFAFVDVPNSTQPFVELFIAVIFFAWAWWLRRQQAIRVAKGMELIGGLVLPLVVFAGLVDEAPVPPDFTGTALVVALPTAALLVAAYTRYTAVHRESTLRYLIGPLVWLAAMTIGFAFKTDEPLVGDAITRLISIQPAFAAAALSVTVIAATRRPQSRLSQPLMRAALVGLPFTYLLTISLSVSERWEGQTPIVILGIATLVAVETLAGWFDRRDLASSLRPVLFALVLAPAAPTLGPGWTGLVAVVAYLLMFEAGRWSVSDFDVSTQMAAAGLIAGAVLSMFNPASMLITFTVLSGWAHMRRRSTRADLELNLQYTVAAAVLPAAVIGALIQVFSTGVGWLITATLIAALASVIQITRSEDAFWPAWIGGASLLVAAASASEWSYVGSDAVSHIVAVGVLALALTLVTRWPVARVWATAAVASMAALMAQELVDLSAAARTSTWAVVGVVFVGTSLVWSGRTAAHRAAIGHLIAAATLISLPGGSAGAAVLWAWTIGWMVTTTVGERGEDPLALLAERVWALAKWPVERRSLVSWLAPALVLVSTIPATLVTASLWSEFVEHRSWTGIALSALATIYALTASVLPTSARLARLLSVGASLLAAAGVAVAAPAPWPSIYATASVLGVALLLSRTSSTSWFQWFAWLMSGVLAVLLAERAGVGTASLHLVVVTWAVVALIGGLLIDDRLAGRRTAGEGVRIAWIRRPVVLGAVVLPVSLSPVFSRSVAVFGWWSLAAAAAYVSLAWLLRAGSITAPAYALAAVGAAALSPRPMFDEPWLFSLIVAPMLAIAVVAERRQSAVDSWLRWDLAPLVVGHAVAAVALIRAVAVDDLTSVMLSLGLLGVLYGLASGRRVWLESGNAFVLLAAADAGAGWLALALAVTSLRGIATVGRTDRALRIAYHGLSLGAAGGAWLALLTWQAVDTLPAIDLTSMVFGVAALSVGVVSRSGKLEIDSLVGWGALSLAGVSIAFISTLTRVDSFDGVWLAVGVGLLAGGMELAAGRLGSGVAVAATAAAGVGWLALLVGLGWSLGSSVELTVVVFGGLGLVVGLLGRGEGVSVGDVVRWGLLASVAVAVAVVVGFGRSDVIDGVWLAVGVAALGIGAQLAAARVGDPLRSMATASVGVSWLLLIPGLGWTADQAASASTLVYGGMALTLGAMARRGMVKMADALRWGTLSSAVVLTVGAASFVLSDADLGLWPAIGLAALALSTELAWPLVGHGSRYAAPVLTVAAWTTMAIGLGWTAADWTTRTGVVFGVLTIAVVEYSRIGSRTADTDSSRGRLSLTRAWATTAAVSLVTAIVTSAFESTAAASAGAAIGLAAIAFASARAALPLSARPLRIVAVVAGLLSLTAAADALAVSDRSYTISLAILSAGASLWYLQHGRSRAGSEWTIPLLTLAGAAWLEAAVFVVVSSGDRRLWALLAVTVGLLAIADGVVNARLETLALGPPLIGAGALLTAVDAAGGSAQWATIPVALVLLAEVEIIRASEREPSGAALVVLEWSGLALLAAPPLVEMFTRGIWLGLIDFAVAGAVLIWAIISRVERRAIAAAALVLTTAVLMIFGAAAGAAAGSALPWILAVGVGFAVMLVAGLIEAYRSRKGRTMLRFAELMEGWE